MSTDNDLIVTVADGLASVVLNRPKALNALTWEMCVELAKLYREWAADPAVEALLIEGAGERAFCAGGDIRKLYDEGRAGGDYPFRFYHDEYRLNALVHHFPKPYVALVDGIVMGGGVGVSVHGRHRIVTENTVFAMPETGIGLFPDVGGSYFLPRRPGEIGMFLGLTGARLKAADTIHAGIGTAFVPAAKLPDLKAALAERPGAADAVIGEFAEDPGEASLPALRDDIDRLFAGDSVEAIIAALHADGGDWATEQADIIATKSPTSLKVTYRQIRNGASRDMDACMRMEWRMVNRIIAGHDFYEGTRAVVIDKDQQPKWQPARLEEVDEAVVEAHFAPLAEGDLPLD